MQEERKKMQQTNADHRRRVSLSVVERVKRKYTRGGIDTVVDKKNYTRVSNIN